MIGQRVDTPHGPGKVISQDSVPLKDGSREYFDRWGVKHDVPPFEIDTPNGELYYFGKDLKEIKQEPTK